MQHILLILFGYINCRITKVWGLIVRKNEIAQELQDFEQARKTWNDIISLNLMCQIIQNLSFCGQFVNV